jgi:hypothetical protein
MLPNAGFQKNAFLTDFGRRKDADDPWPASGAAAGSPQALLEAVVAVVAKEWAIMEALLSRGEPLRMGEGGAYTSASS